MQISLVTTPNEAFGRVMVVDIDTELFWTGSRWSPEMRAAALYLTAEDAKPVYEHLVRTYMGEPVQVFQGVFRVEMRGVAVTAEQAAEYLNRAMKIIQDTAEYGSGPTPDCHATVKIWWGGLTEVFQKQITEKVNDGDD